MRYYATLKAVCGSVFTAVLLSVVFTAPPMAIRLIVGATNGSIIGECSGGLTEVKWILAVIVIVILLGPLRRWIGRHWAFLISVFGGAVFGFFWASFVMSKIECSVPGLPLMSALIVSIAAGRAGPALLRKIERDGKNGHSS